MSEEEYNKGGWG